MKKQYNTTKYRQDKRIAAFVDPQIKEAVIYEAKKIGSSASSVIEKILQEWINGKKK